MRLSQAYNWAEEHNKINESQSGFRRNYSTTDNLFSLNAIIQKYLSRKCGRFYCLYVDFKKAFDTLNHKKIFEMLRRIGVNGHMLNTLQLMYTYLKSCIKTRDGNEYSSIRVLDRTSEYRLLNFWSSTRKWKIKKCLFVPSCSSFFARPCIQNASLWHYSVYSIISCYRRPLSIQDTNLTCFDSGP